MLVALKPVMAQPTGLADSRPVANIGAIFGGIAQGLQSGIQIGQRNQALGLEKQKVDIEQAKSDIELQTLRNQASDAHTYAQAMQPAAQDASAHADLMGFFANARNLATLPQNVRGENVDQLAGTFQQKVGKPLPPNVVNALKKAASEVAVPLIDGFTLSYLNSGKSATQFAQGMTDPTQGMVAMGQQGAAVQANANNPAAPAQTAFQIQQMSIQKSIQSKQSQIEQLRAVLPRLTSMPMITQVNAQINNLQSGVDRAQQGLLTANKPMALDSKKDLVEPSNPGGPPIVKADPNADAFGPKKYQQELDIAAAKAKASEQAKLDLQDQTQKRMFPSSAPDTASGENYLTSLQVGQERYIRSVIEGRNLPPSTRSGSAASLVTNEAINRADPTYDATLYPARNKMRQDYSNERPTAPGGQIRSANTLIQHTGDLVTAFEALKNGDLRSLNAVANRWGIETGKAPAVVYQAIGARIAEESTKYYRGATGAEADVKRNIDTFSNANASPEAAKGTAAQTINALVGVLDPLKSAWDTTMGPVARAPKWLDARSQAALDKIQKFTGQQFDMEQFKQGSSAPDSRKKSAAAATNANVPTVANDADYAKLKSGALFTGPDGKQRVKP